MTLDDLRDLCTRYVPETSRHPSSFDGVDLWWDAHELGHLMTVERARIGEPLFGLDLDADKPYPEVDEHELRCRELAAMSISRRLLTAIGRADLAQDEREGTDTETMYWDDRGRVHEILREFRCLRLPRSRDGLERKLRRSVGE